CSCSCQLPVASCQLPVASCQLPVATVSRQRATGNWQLLQSLLDDRAQRIRIEILFQHPLAGHGDRSVLLGDDDDDGVAVLAQSEGGAVTRAVLELGRRRGGQRQEGA